MLFLVCVVLFGEINEIEPIQYSMILPGIVMDETTDAESDWMGLFRVDCDHYMLRPVELLLVREEGIMYEGERPPGRVVELPEETESPMILISSSIPVFTSGPIPTLIDNRVSLLPDTSFALSSSEIEYAELAVTGEGLFISAPGIRQQVTDTYPGTDPQGPFLELVWAGDLDRDGRVDLLINDVDNSYLIYNWNLFLSSEASRGQMVGRVASFFDVYY